NAPSSPPPIFGGGRLSRAQVAAGPIEVPAWAPDLPDCPRGFVTPREPLDSFWEFDIVVTSFTHTNLDSDPDLGTALVLYCLKGLHVSPQQVVAYDRDSTGRIVLLGRIFGQVDDVVYAREIAARPEGGVRVRACVGDCVGIPTPAPNRFEDREYAWDGS